MSDIAIIPESMGLKSVSINGTEFVFIDNVDGTTRLDLVAGSADRMSAYDLKVLALAFNTKAYQMENIEL